MYSDEMYDSYGKLIDLLMPYEKDVKNLDRYLIKVLDKDKYQQQKN